MIPKFYDRSSRESLADLRIALATEMSDDPALEPFKGLAQMRECPPRILDDLRPRMAKVTPADHCRIGAIRVAALMARFLQLADTGYDEYLALIPGHSDDLFEQAQALFRLSLRSLDIEITRHAFLDLLDFAETFEVLRSLAGAAEKYGAESWIGSALTFLEQRQAMLQKHRDSDAELTLLLRQLADMSS